MSIARITYVEHARQTYEKVAKTDESGARARTPVTRKDGSPKLSKQGRPITRRLSVSDKEKPRPLQTCGKCGKTINIGDPYLWYSVGFRSSYKRVRCRDSACFPKPSERESSGPRSEILAAIENAEEQLGKLSREDVDTTTVEEIVHDVADAFTSAAEQWREADENFGGGGNTENGERADTAEQSASELESWSTSNDDEPDYDECESPIHKEPGDRDEDDELANVGDAPKLEYGDMECDSCSTIRDDWAEALIDEAGEALSDVEVP